MRSGRDATGSAPPPSPLRTLTTSQQVSASSSANEPIMRLPVTAHELRNFDVICDDAWPMSVPRVGMGCAGSVYFHQVSVPIANRVPSGIWYRLLAVKNGEPHSCIEWIANGTHQATHSA